jgi:CheY-like chemotaxis protein
MQAVSQFTLRVLVVDDHDDTRRAIVRLAEQHGFSVKGVDGYATALAAVRAEPFDLMLCDIGMPERDGIDLLAAVKAIRPIRAFAVTAMGMADDVRRIKGAGFDRYFLKPFDVEEFVAAVRQVSNEVAAKREQGSIAASSDHPARREAPGVAM